MESSSLVSSILNRLTRVQSLSLSVTKSLLAPAIDAISRNSSTLETLHIMDAHNASKRRNAPNWAQLCSLLVEKLPFMKKLKCLRLLVGDIDLEKCSNAAELIHKFWSLFPSLEYLLVENISDQNLKAIEELCPQLHSLSLRLGETSEGPILAQVPKLRERLRFLNIDSSNPLQLQSNHLVMSQQFDAWAQAVINKAPPKVGLNLCCGRNLVLISWGRRVFPETVLAKYNKGGLDLTTHCDELFCDGSRFWQLMFDVGGTKPDDDLIIETLHALFNAMGSSNLLCHPAQRSVPFVYYILSYGRIPLLRRFLAEFIAPMNATMKFYALSPFVPLIATPKISAEVIAYLSNPESILEMASTLKLRPNTWEFEHFKTYIVGSL
eukprot:TRINITY_DN15522_c0_g1_i1.p1 TRINITY_DN15522_c0_g1~~TRINITY_DN15522_c0_g1_i1.p1  ORF type:complete len:446 (+),score=64.15 TRINITY_DN15522_c0_g1_i1:200-1339(+)